MYWKRLTYWVLIAVFLVTGIYVEILRRTQPEPQSPADFSVIPRSHGTWISEDIELDARTVDVLKASDHILREYVDVETGSRIGFFVAYFRSSKEGSQIHSPKHCLPGGGWAILERETPAVEVPGRLWRINYFLIGKRDLRQSVFYWYHTRRGETTSEYMLKAKLLTSSLLREPTDAALIRLTVTGSSEASSRASIEKFLTTFSPFIRESLPF